MVEVNNTEIKRCAKCGDTVPNGKILCWCCEHTPQLHTAADKYKENVGFTYKKISLGVTR